MSSIPYIHPYSNALYSLLNGKREVKVNSKGVFSFYIGKTRVRRMKSDSLLGLEKHAAEDFLNGIGTYIRNDETNEFEFYGV